MQSSLVPNAWANQMSTRITSVPDCVFIPTWWANSLLSSFSLQGHCSDFKKCFLTYKSKIENILLTKYTDVNVIPQRMMTLIILPNINNPKPANETNNTRKQNTQHKLYKIHTASWNAFWYFLKHINIHILILIKFFLQSLCGLSDLSVMGLCLQNHRWFIKNQLVFRKSVTHLDSHSVFFRQNITFFSPFQIN